MPLAIVTVNRDHKALTDDFLFNYARFQLRGDIADTLTCEDRGGDLTMRDIEVEIRDRVEGKHIGGEKYDFQLVVFANDYPSRKANLDERCAELRNRTSQVLLPYNVHGFVWVLLSPAAFAEF